MTRFDHSREKTAHARALRRSMTPMEKRLWLRLRGRQLGVSFRRQHPIGIYFADFAAPEIGLVLELDGGQHGMQHRRQADEARTRVLGTHGFRVLRFWNIEIFDNLDGVVETIWLACQSHSGRVALTPTPTLPLAGGGGSP